MVTINGKEEDLGGRIILEYLHDNEYDTNNTTVEINGNLLFTTLYPTTIMIDGDEIKIIRRPVIKEKSLWEKISEKFHHKKDE